MCGDRTRFANTQLKEAFAPPHDPGLQIPERDDGWFSWNLSKARSILTRSGHCLFHRPEGLQENEYGGVLSIQSNDPNAPEVQIEVILILRIESARFAMITLPSFDGAVDIEFRNLGGKRESDYIGFNKSRRTSNQDY
jgi:hypothetical protein